MCRVCNVVKVGRAGGGVKRPSARISDRWVATVWVRVVRQRGTGVRCPWGGEEYAARFWEGWLDVSKDCGQVMADWAQELVCLPAALARSRHGGWGSFGEVLAFGETAVRHLMFRTLGISVNKVVASEITSGRTVEAGAVNLQRRFSGAWRVQRQYVAARRQCARCCCGRWCPLYLLRSRHSGRMENEIQNRLCCLRRLRGVRHWLLSGRFFRQGSPWEQGR